MALLVAVVLKGTCIVEGLCSHSRSFSLPRQHACLPGIPLYHCLVYAQALVSYVALPSARLPQPPAASQQVLPASSFLAAVAREEAAAAADAALDLLLLIAYLGKIRSLGSFSFHGPQAQGGIAWQSRVAAQVVLAAIGISSMYCVCLTI